ncbi:MAG: tRNA threonylcarbamoyladenosine dehydratase [Clostridiales bacterium]|nr:tRNA threonylcarbamoyladenosine dehydratase [Clostridiales bacterium]
MDILTRTEILIGKENIEKLKNSSVIIFGVGGVGSFCVEAIARCGVSNIHIVDDDTISITNINRQIIATQSTIGKDKTEVVKQRILDINPNTNVTISKIFYTKDTVNTINLSKYDYVIDAIDTISSKILLVEEATKLNIPIISSMGTGNKLDPTKFVVSDIYKTSMCPLAKVMRYELKKRGIKKLKVVYSTEKPIKPAPINIDKNAKSTSPFRDTNKRRETPGSISFVPSVAGLIIASQVINDILKNN